MYVLRHIMMEEDEFAFLHFRKFYIYFFLSFQVIYYENNHLHKQWFQVSEEIRDGLQKFWLLFNGNCCMKIMVWYTIHISFLLRVLFMISHYWFIWPKVAWIKYDPIYWCISASSGLNELIIPSIWDIRLSLQWWWCMIKVLLWHNQSKLYFVFMTISHCAILTYHLLSAVLQVLSHFHLEINMEHVPFNAYVITGVVPDVCGPSECLLATKS